MWIYGRIWYLLFLKFVKEFGPTAPIAIWGRFGVLVWIRHFKDHVLLLARPLASHQTRYFTWHANAKETFCSNSKCSEKKGVGGFFGRLEDLRLLDLETTLRVFCANLCNFAHSFENNMKIFDLLCSDSLDFISLTAQPLIAKQYLSSACADLCPLARKTPLPLSVSPARNLFLNNEANDVTLSQSMSLAGPKQITSKCQQLAQLADADSLSLESATSEPFSEPSWSCSSCSAGSGMGSACSAGSGMGSTFLGSRRRLLSSLLDMFFMLLSRCGWFFHLMKHQIALMLQHRPEQNCVVS